MPYAKCPENGTSVLTMGTSLHKSEKYLRMTVFFFSKKKMAANFLNKCLQSIKGETGPLTVRPKGGKSLVVCDQTASSLKMDYLTYSDNNTNIYPKNIGILQTCTF